MRAEPPSSAGDAAASNEETVTIEFSSTPPPKRTNAVAAKRKVCEDSWICAKPSVRNSREGLRPSHVACSLQFMQVAGKCTKVKLHT
jgi:hypothetical protein